jgi:predicted nuclease of predicted toxin-antitoxin system
MRLLLDQGLPRSIGLYLRNPDTEVLHVGEVGLSTASDSKILDFARQQGMVVVTLDADFHAMLALSAAIGPSVIRVRIEGLRAELLATLLMNVLGICADDLEKGAMVSVTENGARVRRLRLLG